MAPKSLRSLKSLSGIPRIPRVYCFRDAVVYRARPDSLGRADASKTSGCVTVCETQLRLGPATRYERRDQLKRRQPKLVHVARQKGSVGLPTLHTDHLGLYSHHVRIRTSVQ